MTQIDFRREWMGSNASPQQFEESRSCQPDADYAAFFAQTCKLTDE
jgi:hypothetical protein